MATKPEIFQVMQATFMRPPASSQARGSHSLLSKTAGNLQLEIDDGFGQPKGWSNSIAGTSDNMGSQSNNRKLAGSMTKRDLPTTQVKKTKAKNIAIF